MFLFLVDSSHSVQSEIFSLLLLHYRSILFSVCNSEIRKHCAFSSTLSTHTPTHTHTHRHTRTHTHTHTHKYTHTHTQVSLHLYLVLFVVPCIFIGIFTPSFQPSFRSSPLSSYPSHTLNPFSSHLNSSHPIPSSLNSISSFSLHPIPSPSPNPFLLT